MPIERNNPIVCYVTRRESLKGAEPGRALAEKIRMAIAAGVDWVQIREKDLPGRELVSLAREAVAMARQASQEEPARLARIIVNDRLDVAVAAGAAGVHLGGASLPMREVSEWRRTANAPRDFLVGVSCHGLGEAREAEAGGADYIFFGPVFETPEKLAFGAPQGLEKLGEACRAVKIPVLAIGGANIENAEGCLRAGAAGIAAIRMFQEARDEKELREIVTRVRGVV